MAKFVRKWLITAAALWVTATVVARVVPGRVWITDLGAALVVALALSLANAIVRPVLFVLTLPLTLLTLGLFTFILNALMVSLVAALVPGFRVASFFTALWFSALLSVVSRAIDGIVS